jgi:hypothetical protein
MDGGTAPPERDEKRDAARDARPAPVASAYPAEAVAQGILISDRKLLLLLIGNVVRTCLVFLATSFAIILMLDLRSEDIFTAFKTVSFLFLIWEHSEVPESIRIERSIAVRLMNAFAITFIGLIILLSLAKVVHGPDGPVCAPDCTPLDLLRGEILALYSAYAHELTLFTFVVYFTINITVYYEFTKNKQERRDLSEVLVYRDVALIFSLCVFFVMTDVILPAMDVGADNKNDVIFSGAITMAIFFSHVLTNIFNLKQRYRTE